MKVTGYLQKPWGWSGATFTGLCHEAFPKEGEACSLGNCTFLSVSVAFSYFLSLVHRKKFILSMTYVLVHTILILQNSTVLLCEICSILFFKNAGLNSVD